MQIQPLIDICSTQIQRFAKQIDALDLNVYAGKKQVIWRMTTTLSQLDIIYLKTGSLLHAPSTLYARIFLYKNDAFSLLLHEIQQLWGLQANGFSIYPYIESPQRMAVCIGELLSNLQALLPQLRNQAEHSYASARAAKWQEIARILSISPSDLPPQGSEYEDMYYARIFRLYEERVLLPRFATAEGPFMQLAMGNKKRAEKIYTKWETKNALTACEQQLLAHLRQSASVPKLYTSECDSVAAILPHATSGAEGKRILWGVVLCYLFFVPIFCGLFGLLQALFSAGTVFYAGCSWQYGFVAAGLPAIFGGMALRRPLMPLLAPKQKNAALAADRMLNSKKANIFIYTVFGIAVVCSLLLSALIICDHVRFYEDRLAYPKSESFPITGAKEQPYSALSGLYLIQGRYNPYGEYIPRSSYVLCFEDGTLLDLDGYLSLEETQAHILPLVIPYSGPPETLESDRELPNT